MSATWKTVRVFISSTFRDMQAERDHLVRFVFPKLRQELLQRRIHLVDVDLRWGVTSEQDALSVCREVVDECRPRFLCMLGGRYGWVPPGKTRSITADEVHYGVLDRDLANRDFAYFYFRDPSATAAMVEVAPGEFREPAGSHGADSLAELKAAIIEVGLQPFIYRAQWDDQSRRLIGLKEFGDRVYEDLKQSIDQEFGPTTGEKPDEFTEENAGMEAFIEERVQRFVLGSRQPVWNELRQHAESTGGNGYLCLTGAAGSGKSALLGKFCQDYREAHPQDLVIPHFVGASPGSTDVRRTLRRLCHELVTGAGLTAEIPEDLEKLRVASAEILHQASAKKRVVILLDAINQFDSTTQLGGWSWLPEELPATARLILSALSGPALESLQHRRQPPRPLELQPLDAHDREAIIEEFLHRYRKSLTDGQRAALLAKADAGTPLYLLVALEELRTLGTYEEITERIAQLPPNARALFIWILERLEDDDGFRDASGRKIGRELVSRFVSFLGASRHGLSQQEIVELLAPGDPQGNVAALAQLLRPYLMQRGELLDFYHGQFREAAGQAYLKGEDKAIKAHTQLAEYFHAQGYWCESIEDQRQRAKRLPPTPRPANARKVDELPWQRLTIAKLSGEWEPVEVLFTDLFFLEAKAETGKVIELIADFVLAVAALPVNRPMHRILRLLGKAVSLNVDFIVRHPTTLFQCMWNTCWWYDCPEATKHNGTAISGLDLHNTATLEKSFTLTAVLESWRPAKANDALGLPWLRSLRPPRISLGSSPEFLLHGHEDDVTCVAVSPDGNRIASGSLDGTVCVWDVATRQRVQLFEGHNDDHITDVLFLPDGHYVASAACYDGVRLWRSDSGREVVHFKVKARATWCIAVAPDGGQIACGTSDGIYFWELRSQRLLHFIGSEGNEIYSVQFSPSGKELASGSWDQKVRLYDVQNGTQLSVMHGHKSTVCTVAFSPDGRGMASGSSEESILLWDAPSGRRIARFKAENTWVNEVAYSPDGTALACASDDGCLRIWDTRQAREPLVLRFPGEKLTCVQYFPSGGRIVTGASGGAVSVWDSDTVQPPPPLTEQAGGVTDITFSPKGQFVATAEGISGIASAEAVATLASFDDIFLSEGTIHIWSTVSGRQVRCLGRHKSEIKRVLFSPDERFVISTSRDRTVRVWDNGTGVELHCLSGHSNLVHLAAVSPDSHWLATGDFAEQASLCLWNIRNGRRMYSLDVCYPRDLEFSPDGSQIAAGLGDNTSRIWSTVSGYESCRFRGHTKPVYAVAFSLDGERLATGSEDGTIRIWDVRTASQLLCINLVGETPYAVGFSSDGSSLFSVLGSEVCLWDTVSGKCNGRSYIDDGRCECRIVGNNVWCIRVEHGEAILSVLGTGDAMNWIGAELSCVTLNPSGSAIAGAWDGYVYIAAIEYA